MSLILLKFKITIEKNMIAVNVRQLRSKYVLAMFFEIHRPLSELFCSNCRWRQIRAFILSRFYRIILRYPWKQQNWL